MGKSFRQNDEYARKKYNNYRDNKKTKKQNHKKFSGEDKQQQPQSDENPQ